MMNNILQQQSIIQRLSNDQLKEKLKAPAADGTSVLVLAEAQRRADLNSRVQGRGPHRTVVESLGARLAQSLPQQQTEPLQQEQLEAPQETEMQSSPEFGQGLSGFAGGGVVKKKRPSFDYSSYGIDFEKRYKPGVISLESSGDSTTMNPNGKYGGLYGLDMRSDANTAGSYRYYAKKYGMAEPSIYRDKNGTLRVKAPVEDQDTIFREGYTPDNIKHTPRPSEENLYFSHKYGPGAVRSILNSYQVDPNTPMESITNKNYSPKFAALVNKQNRLHGVSVSDERSKVRSAFGLPMFTPVGMDESMTKKYFGDLGIDQPQENMVDVPAEEPERRDLIAEKIREDEAMRREASAGQDKLAAFEAMMRDKNFTSDLNTARAGLSLATGAGGFSHGGGVRGFDGGEGVVGGLSQLELARKLKAERDLAMMKRVQAEQFSGPTDAYITQPLSQQGASFGDGYPDLGERPFSYADQEKPLPVRDFSNLPLNVVQQDVRWTEPTLKDKYQYNRDKAKQDWERISKLNSAKFGGHGALIDFAEGVGRMGQAIPDIASYGYHKLGQGIAGVAGSLFGESRPGVSWDDKDGRRVAAKPFTAGDIPILNPNSLYNTGPIVDPEAPPPVEQGGDGGGGGPGGGGYGERSLGGTYEDVNKIIPVRPQQALYEKLLGEMFGDEQTNKDWNQASAMMNAGAAMMGSTSGNFLRSVAPGLSAYNTTMDTGRSTDKMMKLKNLGLLGASVESNQNADMKKLGIAGDIYSAEVGANSRVEVAKMRAKAASKQALNVGLPTQSLKQAQDWAQMELNYTPNQPDLTSRTPEEKALRTEQYYLKVEEHLNHMAQFSKDYGIGVGTNKTVPGVYPGTPEEDQ